MKKNLKELLFGLLCVVSVYGLVALPKLFNELLYVLHLDFHLPWVLAGIYFPFLCPFPLAIFLKRKHLATVFKGKGKLRISWANILLALLCLSMVQFTFMNIFYLVTKAGFNMSPLFIPGFFFAYFASGICYREEETTSTNA